MAGSTSQIMADTNGLTSELLSSIAARKARNLRLTTPENFRKERPRCYDVAVHARWPSRTAQCGQIHFRSLDAALLQSFNGLPALFTVMQQLNARRGMKRRRPTEDFTAAWCYAFRSASHGDAREASLTLQISPAS